MIAPAGSVKIEEIVDPTELADSAAREQKFAHNLRWFEVHAREIGAGCAGKCICIAGQELFVADTPSDALAQAHAAHPEDDGFFLHYIHKDKAARIYAAYRVVA
ncbi:MAG TPA: hypothetical protein VGI40_14125 [Pirellulaceae bacterium]|jgi:hypothetical protein